MLSKLSVKKPYTVIVGILLVIALGVISFTHMTTDLLPSMDLPYAIVYTTYTGATPERVESDVTRPLEASFATLTDVKNITSTSSENLSLVVLEFASGADMNTAMIEISSSVEQLSGGWDDAIGTPVVMKLNPDMLPVTVSTVSMDDADLLELSDYVEEELLPRYEAVDGVARVTPSGVLTQQVDITIEQSRIDALNSAILREVDADLAEVEQELLDAQSQISSGKSQLSRARKRTYAQIDEAIAAIDAGSAQMPAAIEGLTAQREELSAQLEALKPVLAQLESLVNLTDEEKAQLQQVADSLSALEAQRQQLQQQLDEMTDEPSSALQQQLADAQKAREEQLALKAAQEKYIQDLLLLDPEALRQTIAQLEADMAANEGELATVRSELEGAITTRDELTRQAEDLKARIAALEAAQATATPEVTVTPEVTATPDATATPEVTATPDATATSEVAATPEATATSEITATPEMTATLAAAETPETAETPAATASENVALPQKTAQAEATNSIAPSQTVSGENTPSTQPTAVESATADAVEAATPAATAAAETASPESAPTQSADEPQALSLVDALLGGAAQAEEQVKTLEELKAELAGVEAQLEATRQQVETLSARHDSLRETLDDQSAALEEARASLALVEDGEISIQSRIEAARAQIATCEARIAELDEEIAQLTQAIENSGNREQLVAQIAELDRQIAEIKASEAYQSYLMISDGAALEAQYAQTQAAVSQLEAGIAQMDGMLEKLNQGILPGGMIEGIDEDTNLSEARQQLVDARKKAQDGFSQASSALRDAEDELATAMKEFHENRDEALENAGIDGIITVQSVSAILGSQNLDLPAGYVSNGDDRYLVSVGPEFASLAELKQIKLFSLGLDTVDDVRLLDVANVEISDNSADLFTMVNGERGIMLSFEKQSTASTAEVAKNITEESQALMAENPRLHVTEMMNQGDYINLIVDSVLDNLVSGGLLAILVLLLFLMDWRPTLIVALSIPASVVVAFVCMYFMGITLNVMSLSGLALGVGMLVDNSIVSIENIYRLRDEEGLPILTASIRGVNQVGGALFASTLTTICVFLPVVFVEGMARDLFSDMGLTIAFSLLASLLVAMTVVPCFSATLFRKSKPRRHRFFEAFQRLYTRLLRGALRFKALVLLVAVALLVFSGMQVMNMPISFMPNVNSQQMSATLSYADSEIPESQQEAEALAIMEAMRAIDGVQDVSLTRGGSLSMMASMGGGGGEFSYYALIDPESGRDNAEIAREMRDAAAQWADGTRAVFSVQESTMDLSAFAGQGININIRGENIENLRTAAREVADLCTQVPGAENIDDGSKTVEPKLMITVDKELASDASLSVAQVYQYVAQRLYGATELTSATLDGREYTLYVSEDRNENLRPEDIEDMEIEVETAEETRLVRIGDIAQISQGESLSSIHRENQRRTVTVSFEIAEGYSANLVSRDLEALLKDYQPPEGCSIALGGENESVMGYMSDLVTMLGIAILFIFLIMVAQFQSFKSPIIVMFTIPLAFTGGLLALIVTGMDLSIISMVGFLVLSGVVVNNGIVFIDSVNQMRISGMSKREALVETGRIRLRPILMTALTTILGMSTMALAQGMGAEMMQPMAVVTIGGLTYATLMTLFVVPVLYDLFNGEKMKSREIEMMKEAAGMHREGFDDAVAAADFAAPQSAASAPASPDPIPEKAPDSAQEPAEEKTPAPAQEPAEEKAPDSVQAPAEEKAPVRRIRIRF